jgi:hypothetical protein
MDPGIHAEMTHWVMRQKELERERDALTAEVEKWSRRVTLATDKGMHDLAGEAQAKLDEIRAKLAEIGPELDKVEMEKSALRMEARRPGAAADEALIRAETMVEQGRMAGLDPEAGKAERELAELEAEVALDFGEDDDD